MRLLAYRLGAWGSFFGACLGALQAGRVGLVAIGLSATAFAAVDFMTRHPAVTPAARATAAAGIAIPTTICLAAVGALWLVPAALLAASLLVESRAWSHEHRAHRLAAH